MSPSKEPEKPVEPAWDRGWAEHAEAQRRRIADLPLWVRIDWLEETQRMLARLRRVEDENPADPEA